MTELVDDWQTHAACAGHPQPSLWWPEKHTGADNHGRQAKAICAQCPVVVDCLIAAIERNEEHGIWGGAGESLRRWLARAWKNRDLEPDAWETALEHHLADLNGDHVRVIDRNGPNATHGLRVTYNRGCRCRACRWAAMDDIEEKAGRSA